MEETAHCIDLNLENYGVDEEFRSCCEEDDDWQDVEESLPVEQVEGNKEVSLMIYQWQEEEDPSSSRINELLQEDEDSLECSLRLCEECEEDVSDCSLRLSEVEEEDVLDCERRLSEDPDDNFLESSPRLCETRRDDFSECSLQFSEDDDVSECSLIFSEDHENDVLKCSLILFENHDEEDDDDDEFLVRVFSKGVSVSENCGLGSKISGIGVVMEKPDGVPFLQVQKKLDFFVEELIAEHLALMDGLLEALRNGCCKVLAFTDSNELYRSITRSDTDEDQLVIALQERIQELADKFESFVLRLAPKSVLKKPLQLAQDATGILCRCGHDFCFSYGEEYRYGTQTCQCEFHDENSDSSQAPSEHETELWRWDCFNPLPSTIDGYTEQEKTQLALIQRFLAGGISLDNHNLYQSPPRSSDSYLDAIKDLNQLPWLESFISVIGDSYQEDHIH